MVVIFRAERGTAGRVVHYRQCVTYFNFRLTALLLPNLKVRYERYPNLLVHYHPKSN